MSSTIDRTGSAGQTYEVVHKWTPGDGAVAIESFLDEFNQTHSGVSIEDTVSDSLGLTVKSRILQENPPEFWMAWPGNNLRPYYDAGVLRDVTEIWEDNNLGSKYVDGVRDIAQFGGNFVSVPTNVHRINNLFYNTELAEKVGVDPGRISDPHELVEVMAQIQDEHDVWALSQGMKSPRMVVQLWEVILVGQFGAGIITEITDGDATRHRDEIVEALEIITDMVELAPEDVIFRAYADVAQGLAEKEAVMMVEGDWLAEIFQEREGYDYGSEWSNVPFPGTEGTYHVVMDGVMATKAADLDSGAREFLEYAATPHAQTVFNGPKGSIPPRTDVDMSEFPPLLQAQHKDFQRSQDQPPTIAHGLAVDPDQQVEMETTMANFIGEWDTGSTASDIVSVLDG